MHRDSLTEKRSDKDYSMEMSLTKPDIMELCRICEETEDLVDISSEEFMHLNDKLHQISDFEEPYSCWLQYICVNCSIKLESAFDFKTQCEFTYRKLVDQMENNTFVESNTNYGETGKNKYFYTQDVEDDVEVEREQIYFEELEVVKNGETEETINLDSDSSDTEKEVYSVSDLLAEEKSSNTKDMETLPIECDVSVDSEEEFMASLDVKSDHLDDSNAKYVCSSCDKTFSTKTELNNHIAMMHYNRKSYDCNICGSQYTRYATLYRHMKIHSAQAFPCDFCGKAFKTKTYLKMHRKVHLVAYTSKGESIDCQICGHTSNDPVEHTKHIGVHNNEKPHKCEECGKSFLRKQYLMEHHRMHTGERPFPCKICSYAFRYRTHLSRHLKTHNGNIKAFKCLECGKTFLQSGALTAHMSIHSDDLFKCLKCPRRFRNKRELAIHSKRCKRRISKKKHK